MLLCHGAAGRLAEKNPASPRGSYPRRRAARRAEIALLAAAEPPRGLGWQPRVPLGKRDSGARTSPGRISSSPIARETAETCHSSGCTHTPHMLHSGLIAAKTRASQPADGHKPGLALQPPQLQPPHRPDASTVAARRPKRTAKTRTGMTFLSENLATQLPSARKPNNTRAKRGKVHKQHHPSSEFAAARSPRKPVSTPGLRLFDCAA